MNTLNSLSIDVVTRAVTGTLPDLEKVGDDLIFQVIFSNGGVVSDPAFATDLSPISLILLTLKETDTGEILLQSDGWNHSDGKYYLHASLSGSGLEGAMGKGKSLSLLGEIQWVQNNPFYNSENANIGPATIKTSSKNFIVKMDSALN